MKRPCLIALSLALLTFLLYLPCCWHEFIVFDDRDYVTENGTVRAGLTWAGLKWAFNAWHFSNWHPLTWLSHMADCQFFGLNPGLHHLTNLLLHAANTALLFFLMLRLTKAMGVSAVIAALFAWHPMHVESVAWVAERKDVLSIFFGLLALISYVRYAETNGPGKRAGLYYGMALGCFACSLMSKAMLVTLPCVMLLLDYWPLKRTNAGTARRLVIEKIPFFLLTIASCVVTYLAQRTQAVVSLEHFPLNLRIGNAITSYGDYFIKLICPANLAVIYPLPKQLSWGWVTLVALALAVVTVLVLRARDRKPFLLTGWFWFLGTLIPVIGLVQVGGAAMADRYSYFPSIGLFLMVGYGGGEWVMRNPARLKIYATTAFVVLAGCVGVTIRQLSYWETSETLFTHTLAVTQNNSAAHSNLGLAFQMANRPLEAIQEYRTAIAIHPQQAGTHNNLANLLWDNGQKIEALNEYRETLRLNPNLPRTHAKLGQLLSDLGRWAEAEPEYDAAIRLDPANSQTYSLKGDALLSLSRDAEAVIVLRKGLAFNPNDIATLIRLAKILATDEKPGVRNSTEAVALAERANRFTGGDTPYVLDVLAMAYAEAGRFSEAISTEQNVIDIAVKLGDTDAASVLKGRLSLYQQNQPYREAFSKNSSNP